MDKILGDGEIIQNGENDDTKEYSSDEKSNEELSRIPSNNWWNNDSERKLDPQHRWSFGSDISAEAAEIIQNRLCCSPVDEFDSTVSSENEELIVNCTDDRSESYDNYVQLSPACSPTSEKTDNEEHQNHDVDDTADDELIDYSKRYTTDSSMSVVQNKHTGSSHVQPRRQNVIVNTVSQHVPENKPTVANSKSKVDPYSDYAETDLDQPTDYSLRYAEEDTDEDEKEEPQFYCTGELEDNVKTYYTEGTPHQTPSNISTATSMSDLLSLEDPRGGVVESAYKQQFIKEHKQETYEKCDKTLKDYKNQMRRKYVLEDSKIPVLEEKGEPCTQRNGEKDLVKLRTPPQSPVEPCDKEREIKTVTFNIDENPAQETPLMFSRSSSLDSLSEFDQQSIHDDGSSIISDFSHRESGVISPSELPDSPTQTMPPYVKKIKQQNAKIQQLQTQPQKIELRAAPRTMPIERLPLTDDEKLENQKRQSSEHAVPPSVFEDGLVLFTEESMSRPLSTRASSLSALTIDDEDGVDECDNRDIINRIAVLKVMSSTTEILVPAQHQQRIEPCRDAQPDKLSNRHSNYRNERAVLPPKNEDDNICTSAYVNKEAARVKYSNKCLKETRHEEERRKRSPAASRGSPQTPQQRYEHDEIIIGSDTIRTYCTEDTPTYISPNGSQSNLSALSILSMSEDNLSFEVAPVPPRTERGVNRADDDDDDDDDDIEYATDEEEQEQEQPSSEFSDEENCSYEDGEENARRIDVSPFDSQLNLAGFALLSIEEESEDGEEETNYETEGLGDDASVYERLAHDNSDEDEQAVLEECIKSGASRLARQRLQNDQQRRLF